jgi:hypothetical protein
MENRGPLRSRSCGRAICRPGRAGPSLRPAGPRSRLLQSRVERPPHSPLRLRDAPARARRTRPCSTRRPSSHRRLSPRRVTAHTYLPLGDLSSLRTLRRSIRLRTVLLSRATIPGTAPARRAAHPLPASHVVSNGASFPMMNLFPDRNLLPPEAISSVVLWLASDEAQHRTGCALPVDAG